MNSAHYFQMSRCSIVAVVEHVRENKMCPSTSTLRQRRVCATRTISISDAEVYKAMHTSFYADCPQDICANSFLGQMCLEMWGRDHFQGRVACAVQL